MHAYHALEVLIGNVTESVHAAVCFPVAAWAMKDMVVGPKNCLPVSQTLLLSTTTQVAMEPILMH